MDSNRKKQLMQEYKNRKPEMGIISFRCNATNESFLEISKDTKASMNSIRGKLASNWHPNKKLQALWDQYGEDGFTLSVLQLLKYEDPLVDHTEDLKKLREECLAKDDQATKMWR